jgi:hypothetical protein
MAASGAFKIRVYMDVDYVGAGTGQAFNAAANHPGLGSGLTAGETAMAQSRRYQQAEQVQAVNPAIPTQTEFRTAITQAATDLGLQLTTAEIATLQGWALGNP